MSAGEDVTELRAGEERLSRAAKEWSETFDAMTDMIMLLGPDYRIIRANRTFIEFLGLEEEGIVGRLCYELVHGTCEPYGNCPLERMMETGRREESKLHFDERNIWAEVMVDPIRDELGEITMVVHTIRDVTGSHAAREALRESEERYRLLLENAGAGIGYYDPDGRVVLFNRQALEHMGGRLEDYAGKSTPGTVRPRFRPGHPRPDQGVRAGAKGALTSRTKWSFPSEGDGFPPVTLP